MMKCTVYTDGYEWESYMTSWRFFFSSIPNMLSPILCKKHASSMTLNIQKIKQQHKNMHCARCHFWPYYGHTYCLRQTISYQSNGNWMDKRILMIQMYSLKYRVNVHSLICHWRFWHHHPWHIVTGVKRKRTSVITSFGVDIEWTGRDSTRWVVNFHSTGVRIEWNSLLNAWTFFTPQMEWRHYSLDFFF